MSGRDVDAIEFRQVVGKLIRDRMPWPYEDIDRDSDEATTTAEAIAFDFQQLLEDQLEQIRRDQYAEALEACVRDLRDALNMCANDEDGWPDTSVADAYEASRVLVPDSQIAGPRHKPSAESPAVRLTVETGGRNTDLEAAAGAGWTVEILVGRKGQKRHVVQAEGIHVASARDALFAVVGRVATEPRLL